MKIEFPQKDECLDPARASDEVLEFLATRRSGLTRAMKSPGPSARERDLILKIAARVPDHRKLAPWRFIVFEGSSRAKFGDVLAKRFARDNPDMPDDRVEHERERFLRAPLVVGVVSSPKDCVRGTPKWEQKLSSGAVCMNMLLAARASGYAAQWLTEWYAFDKKIDKALGLSNRERMAGFVYIGTAGEHSMERPRPDMDAVTSRWSPIPK